ncbi:hypothetical protein V8E36_002497 [Tilletia maclaganii]
MQQEQQPSRAVAEAAAVTPAQATADEQHQHQQPQPATSAARTTTARDHDEEQWALRYIYPTAGGRAHDPRNNSIPIVTQDANGPCSLVALSNILLLRGGSLTISPPDRPAVDFSYLSRSLAELFFTQERPRSEGEADDWQRTLTQALDILPTTRHGLDVNVDFRSPTAFHPPHSAQLALFRLFGIRLVHGWLPDPADRPTYEALVPSSRANLASDDSPGPSTSVEEEEWRLGSDYDAVIQRLVAAQDLAGSFADLNVNPEGRADEGPRNEITAEDALADQVGQTTLHDPVATPSSGSVVKAEFVAPAPAVALLVDPEAPAGSQAIPSESPAVASSSAERSTSASVNKQADPGPAISSLSEPTTAPPQSDPDTWTPTQKQMVQDALHIRAFLEANPTQLSVYGLFALASALRPGELCALFRNMHLSCLYRRREDEGGEARLDGGGGPLPNEHSAGPPHQARREQQHLSAPTPYLFTLVTDAILAREHPQIVWESLEDVHGSAGGFYDAQFRRVEIGEQERRTRRQAQDHDLQQRPDGAEASARTDGREDASGLLAHAHDVPEGFWDPVVPGTDEGAYESTASARRYPPHSMGGPDMGDADYALAYQLQQEEREAADRRAARRAAREREMERQQERSGSETHAPRYHSGGTYASEPGSGPVGPGSEGPGQSDSAAATALAGAHEDLGISAGGSGGGRKASGKKSAGKGGKGDKEKCIVM